MSDCDHPADAILADPDTGCVQCHVCGHVFEYLTQRDGLVPDAMRTSATELEPPWPTP